MRAYCLLYSLYSQKSMPMAIDGWVWSDSTVIALRVYRDPAFQPEPLTLHIQLGAVYYCDFAVSRALQWDRTASAELPMVFLSFMFTCLTVFFSVVEIIPTTIFQRVCLCVCVHVSVCLSSVCTCVYRLVCICVWRMEVGIGYLPLSFSTVVFEAVFCNEPSTQVHLEWLPISPRVHLFLLPQ